MISTLLSVSNTESKQVMSTDIWQEDSSEKIGNESNTLFGSGSSQQMLSQEKISEQSFKKPKTTTQMEIKDFSNVYMLDCSHTRDLSATANHCKFKNIEDIKLNSGTEAKTNLLEKELEAEIKWHRWLEQNHNEEDMCLIMSFANHLLNQANGFKPDQSDEKWLFNEAKTVHGQKLKKIGVEGFQLMLRAEQIYRAFPHLLKKATNASKTGRKRKCK